MDQVGVAPPKDTLLPHYYIVTATTEIGTLMFIFCIGYSHMTMKAASCNTYL